VVYPPRHVIYFHMLQGTLIPVGEDIKAFTVEEDVEWILIVEKDVSIARIASRTKLLTADTGRPPDPLPPALRLAPTPPRTRAHHHGAFILLSFSPAHWRRGATQGKGYPDVATRQLVATLSACLPRRIPLLALVDGDPYGLDILAVYKYGSRAMAHEAEKLAAPRVKYLGVFASELARCPLSFLLFEVEYWLDWEQLRRGPRRAATDHQGRREEGVSGFVPGT
jgi:meiotic recombination protein SPO11